VEKRLFIFVVLSIVIWGGYLGLQYFFNPPKPKPAVAKPDKDKPAKEKVDNKQADNKPAVEKPEKVPAENEPANQVARRRVTLGSLDPTSGYTLLVTFDNRGAGIERIEFNDRYHDLDDHSGYLGHLALTDAKGGAEVNVVGPGTPAAIAGLAQGDVITAVSGTPVKKAVDLIDHLQKQTKPKDVIALTVQRGTSEVMTVNATLTRRPLELIRPEDNSGAEPVDKEHPGDFGPVGPPSYRMTLQRIGETTIATGEQEIADLPSLHHSNWEVEVDANEGKVTFTTELTAEQLEEIGAETSLAVTKTYRLAAKTDGESRKAFHLDFHVSIKNTGEKPQLVAYRLEGPNGLPLEGWWYLNKVHPGWAGAGARDVRDFNPSTGSHRLIGLPKLVADANTQVKAGNPPTNTLFGANDKRELGYLAVDGQYFASALLPGEILAEPASKPAFAVDAAFALPLNKIKDTKWLKTTNISFYLDSEAKNLEPGSELTSDYVIFAGPKDPDILAAYRLDELVENGWFGWVVRPLKGVLHFLYWGVRNYGIAIILLTVIVRLCLLPISIRQAKSAAVMQAMAPELAKIKEKYANDMEKQAIAQRELFAKHGVNPMGGCLLMFFQLPVFIGLYRCLATDIDLREAALIPGIAWASNLAGPDALFRWKEYLWPIFADEGQGWLGPYFNIFPLITIFLFMVQQKLFTPPAITEEQKQQQKIMNFMTIFMGVMFYKVPAGLCIYFITSSLWGIAERKLLPKPKPGAVPEASKVPEKSDAPSGSTAKKLPAAPSWIERIMGMADEQLKESKSSVPRKKTKK
jgi:YidC/Oxa1 family membrane protein insertase